jgi:hypothetical protein
MAYAKGKYAKGLCDRCGWKYDYLALKVESGTGIKVCDECNDGMWNRVDHPLNFPPKNLIDNIAIRDPNPDRSIEEETTFWLYDQDGNLITDQDGDPFG